MVVDPMCFQLLVDVGPVELPKLFHGDREAIPLVGAGSPASPGVQRTQDLESLVQIHLQGVTGIIVTQAGPSCWRYTCWMCTGSWSNHCWTSSWKSLMSSWISCTTARLRLGRSGHRTCHALMVDISPGSGGPGWRPGCSRCNAVCQWCRHVWVGGIVNASFHCWCCRRCCGQHRLDGTLVWLAGKLHGHSASGRAACVLEDQHHQKLGNLKVPRIGHHAMSGLLGDPFDLGVVFGVSMEPLLH